MDLYFGNIGSLFTKGGRKEGVVKRGIEPLVPDLNKEKKKKTVFG